MTVFTESQHKGEFLVSEANGELSREVGTLLSGEVVADGRALALNGAGKLVAADGTLDSDDASNEDIVGFAYGAYDATGADLKGCVYIARLAEVKSDLVKLHPVTDGTAATVTAAITAKLTDRFIRLR